MLASSYRKVLLYFTMKRLPRILTQSFYGKVPEPGQVEDNCQVIKPLIEHWLELAVKRFEAFPQKFCAHLAANVLAIFVLIACKVAGAPTMLSTSIACLAALSSISVVFLSIGRLHAMVAAYVDEASPITIINTQMLALVAQLGLLQMAFCAGIGLSLIDLMLTSVVLIFPLALAMQYFMIPSLLDAIIAQPLSVQQTQAFLAATENHYSDSTLENLFMEDLEGSSISAMSLIGRQHFNLP